MISETGYIWSPLPLTKPDLLRDGGPVDPGLNQVWHEDASPLEVPIPTPWARFETSAETATLALLFQVTTGLDGR